MPKYWGKQIFSHGCFLEAGEKQKAWKKERKKKYLKTMASFAPGTRYSNKVRVSVCSTLYKLKSHFIFLQKKNLLKLTNGGSNTFGDGFGRITKNCRISRL